MNDRKVLLLGIDGLDPSLLIKLLDEGYLENFSKVVEDGVSGYNKVFVPPLSPAIWTSLATGLAPFQHGVLDFIETIKVKGRLRTVIYSFSVLRKKSVWDYLGIYGHKSILVNYPLTYPPYPIRGILVSGFPSPKQNLTAYPSMIISELEKIVPNYKIEYIPPGNASIDSVKQMINEALKSMKKRVRLWKYLIRTYEWDFTSLVLTEIDRVQHIIFGCDCYCETLIKLYEGLDKVVGEILNTVEKYNPDILVVSDHGFEKVDKYVSLPAIMESLHIPYNSSTISSILKSKNIQKTVFLITKAKIMQLLISHLMKTNIFNILDKALSPSSSVGQVVIQNNFSLKLLNGNKKIITLLKKILSRIKDIETNQAIFDKVFTREEYINYILDEFALRTDSIPEGSINVIDHFPDLILTTKSGYEPTINRLPKIVTSTNEGGKIRKTGTHCSMQASKGVFIACGPRVKKQTCKWCIEVGVLDIAPTILALYGIGQPPHMYGKILTNIFDIIRQIPPLA